MFLFDFIRSSELRRRWDISNNWNLLDIRNGNRGINGSRNCMKSRELALALWFNMIQLFSSLVFGLRLGFGQKRLVPCDSMERSTTPPNHTSSLFLVLALEKTFKSPLSGIQAHVSSSSRVGRCPHRTEACSHALPRKSCHFGGHVHGLWNGAVGTSQNGSF